MKVLVINGSARAEGTTTALTRSFMEGAASRGASADMIMLREKSIGYCTNCLKCYAWEGEGVAPCSLRDDMDDVIAALLEADGICFASPVHCGFVTAQMTTFMDRLAWRVMRPAAPLGHCFNLESRVTDKVRALGSIVTAGGMPRSLRRLCDDGTRWLKSNAPLELHGQWIGDVYAAADLERLPETEQDWRRIYFLRRLSTPQLEDARQLGVRMVEALEKGGLRADTLENSIPAALRWVMKWYFARKPLYRPAQ